MSGFFFFQRMKPHHLDLEISEKSWSTKTKSFLASHLWYKAMLKLWRKSWKPFRIYQLTSTANSAMICGILQVKIISFSSFNTANTVADPCKDLSMNHSKPWVFAVCLLLSHLSFLQPLFFFSDKSWASSTFQTRPVPYSYLVEVVFEQPYNRFRPH